MASMDVLVGLVAEKIITDAEGIIIQFKSGEKLDMRHDQDWGEDVYLEEIIGDLQDLVGSAIVSAYKSSSSTTSEYGDVEQWTFYRFVTEKGPVTLRWIGTSNGYYSTEVEATFYPVNGKELKLK